MAAPNPVSPPQKSAFWSCLSCRLLSGAALIGSGVWVYLGPRQVMQQRIPPNMWHIAQMTFAVGLVCWGVVVITDPVGKQKRKGE
ncbi:distal membrane-arm assembly complex protein 1 [Hemicordylus capensis]|uniref:distal membrane-arm assembly complex protein 1 n=1 Tax=Hemicordylus capensis TaxID=884348 RepID=UPI0023033B0E|nr:distal membrane-arm assembly complex protein 1 [Hemicordylus capensis]